MLQRQWPRLLLLLAPFVLWPALAAEPAGAGNSQHTDYHHIGMAAGPPGVMPWGGADGAGHAMFGNLDLTAEQQQAIKDLQQAYRPRWEEFRARGDAIRESFTSVAPDDAEYSAATEKASRDTATLAGDVVSVMARMRADMHAILTPEQHAQIEQQMNDRRERWESWRSRTGQSP